MNAKQFPINSIVRITESIRFTSRKFRESCRDFNVVGSLHQVTGHHPSGADVYLDGGTWSVSVNRIEAVPDAELYFLSSVRDEDLAGTLIDVNLPGDRIVVLKNGSSGHYSDVVKYLDRVQNADHYTDCNGQWIRELLEAGVLLRPGEEEPALAADIPAEYNSVLDVPPGGVVEYVVDDILAAGAMYPYLFRCLIGVFGYDRRAKAWVPVTVQGPAAGRYLTDVQDCWTFPACFRESYDYPALPAKLLSIQGVHLNA